MRNPSAVAKQLAAGTNRVEARAGGGSPLSCWLGRPAAGGVDDAVAGCTAGLAAAGMAVAGMAAAAAADGGRDWAAERSMDCLRRRLRCRCRLPGTAGVAGELAALLGACLREEEWDFSLDPIS